MIFGAFERMLAMRYLRARRQEGFISVFAGFSPLGLGLAVATLTIVMRLLNGLRPALPDRIIWPTGTSAGASRAGPSQNSGQQQVPDTSTPAAFSLNHHHPRPAIPGA